MKMVKSEYDIYEVRMSYINFSVIVQDSIIIMSPSVNGFIGMDFNEFKDRIKKINGNIVKVNFSIIK